MTTRDDLIHQVNDDLDRLNRHDAMIEFMTPTSVPAGPGVNTPMPAPTTTPPPDLNKLIRERSHKEKKS